MTFSWPWFKRDGTFSHTVVIDPFVPYSIIELPLGERFERITLPEVADGTGMDSPEAWLTTYESSRTAFLHTWDP